MCVVLGTRPEAIKMAPVLRVLHRHTDVFEPVLIATSQHREMLVQALAAFHLEAQIDLGLSHANRTLSEFTSNAMLALTRTFASLEPDLLLVQGDTSTVVSAVLAAFYANIPIGHIEAGLRSGDMRRPFPEEANRRIASVATNVHFAPTERARQNLLLEGLSAQDVYVTGNTVVDALRSMPRTQRFEEPRLAEVQWTRHRVVLVTVHRRENLDTGLDEICAALATLTMERPDVEVVFPVHLNPRVRSIVYARLADMPRITLTDPLSYGDLLEVMHRCRFLLTDSGGLQEEAPALRKPVLILRTVTERPEVVESGFGRLVGTDRESVLAATRELLDDTEVYDAMRYGVNPFGDGHAAERIVGIIAERFGLTLGPSSEAFREIA